MSGAKIFADTNLLIRYLNGDPLVQGLVLYNEVHISFISELELYSKSSITSQEEEAIANLIEGSYVHSVSEDLKPEIIRIRKLARLKLPDAIVAATASHNQLPLLTADKDFKKVPQLNLVLLN